MTAHNRQDIKLGEGRSGVVYRDSDPAGRAVARKMFGAHGLTKLVQYLVLGAPNPYLWCEPAIRCAVLRRRILDVLVRQWFDGQLRVAVAHGHRWNAEHRAFEITCELIDGRHVQLHHPYTDPYPGEMEQLRDAIMKPLQQRLDAAGFHGLVWQAGRGNPVAMNNFMRDRNDANAWVWIDLESGVPALFAANPLDLVGYYLPRAWRHRRPLFDDVDVAQLRASLTNAQCAELCDDIDQLEQAQHEWKTLRRHRRSIAYRLSQGDIDHATAEHYANRALPWYLREAAVNAGPLMRRLGRRAVGLIKRVTTIDYKNIAAMTWGMLSSQTFRVHMARHYIARRIERWRQRGQISEGHADDLLNRLERSETGRYITDFGVHLAVKPAVKSLQYGMITPGMAAGMIDPYLGSFLLIVGGALVRTLYTLGRMAQNAVKGRELPWIALIVGVMPVLGNLAFPLQIIFTSAHENAKVAQFIVYDTFSRFGEMLPIWGGADTRTEHAANRLPDHLMRHKLKSSSESDTVRVSA